MPEFISVSSVRRTCGISSSEISDADIEATINEIERQAEDFLKTKLKPTETIEEHDANHKPKLFVFNTPLLRLKQLRVGDTDVTLNNNVRVDEGSGRIILDNVEGNPEAIQFKKRTRILYDYGRREESDIYTFMKSDASSGDTTLTVDNSSDFKEKDYVKVRGLDGNIETTQVKSVGTGSLTVEELIFDHEEGSRVIKTQVGETIIRLLNVVASIQIIIKMIGITYTESTGYSLGELNVQKGVPYTHWQETANRFIKERDRLYKRLQPEYAVRV